MSKAESYLVQFARMSMRSRTAAIDDGGRGGDVTYTDARGTLTFAWEMASYGIEIMVPTAERWEEQTGLPVAERLETLRFIAERASAKRGGPGCTFEVVEGPYAAIQIRL